MRKSFKKLLILLNELFGLLFFPINYCPGMIGNKLRYIYWKMRLESLGNGSIIDVGVQIYNPNWISIGKNTHIDRFSILAAGPIREGKRMICYKSNENFNGDIGKLSIGDNIHVAPYALINGQGGVIIHNNSSIAAGAKIYSISHHYKNQKEASDLTLYKFSNRVNDDQQCIITGPVVIKENSGIGINSVVLPGSTIGENSWVGVLSCVKGEIPPSVIASGCPTISIKNRIKK
jgi:galactoside O-acetyltransferase